MSNSQKRQRSIRVRVRGKLQADVLFLHRMSSDGKRLLDNGTVIFHDTLTQPTIEGPKLLKKDGYYYIIAPAGGVARGWQSVLRSRNIYGPYENRIVLRKGSTAIMATHAHEHLGQPIACARIGGIIPPWSQGARGGE